VSVSEIRKRDSREDTEQLAGAEGFFGRRESRALMAAEDLEQRQHKERSFGPQYCAVWAAIREKISPFDLKRNSLQKYAI
jgi:hypothetical protein